MSNLASSILAPFTSDVDEVAISFSAMFHSMAKLGSHVYRAIPGGPIVVRYIKKSHQNDPLRTFLEVLLFAFLLWYFGRKRSRPANEGSIVKLTEREIDDLCKDWEPEPLTRPLTEAEKRDIAATPVVVGKIGSKVRLASDPSREKTNLTSFDFLGVMNSEKIVDKALTSLRKYGVGTCGPTGFYGTIDVQVDFEKKLAEFVGTEAAIVYAQGFAATSSIIPAFSKRGDIIVADECVNFCLQKGLQISKSNIKYYKHNDMEDLERILKETNKAYEKTKAPLNRRFIVTEGIFENNGDIANIRAILELKNKYKYRIIVDESLSMGVIGSRNAGITDFFGINPQDIDLIVFSLTNAFASSGGVCCASQHMVEHQRLSSAACTYSASLPAILGIAANDVLSLLVNDNSALSTRLRENIATAHDVLYRNLPLAVVNGAPTQNGKGRSVPIEITPAHTSSLDKATSAARNPSQLAMIQYAIENSPLINIKITNCLIPVESYPALLEFHRSDVESCLKVPTNPFKTAKHPELEVALFLEKERILQEIVDEACHAGVVISRAKYVITQERTIPTPSIRIAITAGLPKRDIEKSMTAIANSVKKVIKSQKF